MTSLPRKNPNPKPDDLCSCGHKRSDHNRTISVERHAEVDPRCLRAGDNVLNTCAVYESAPLGDLDCGCMVFDDALEPRYRHDCEACQFLGRLSYDAPLTDDTTEPMAFDLYYCKGPASSILGGTVIARYGDGGPAYASMPRDLITVLIEAVEKRDGSHGTYLHALIEGFNRSKEMTNGAGSRVRTVSRAETTSRKR